MDDLAAQYAHSGHTGSAISLDSRDGVRVVPIPLLDLAISVNTGPARAATARLTFLVWACRRRRLVWCGWRDR